jgi:hypothetical protein
MMRQFCILVTAASTLLASAHAATLTATVTNTPAAMNLSTEGPHDWAHWGSDGTNLFTQKSALLSRITNITLIGTAPVAYVTNGPTEFSWTNGNPVSATTTSNQIAIADSSDPNGAGFELTVAADTTLRQLAVHFGVSGAQAILEAELSDGSASPFGTIATTTSSTNHLLIINYAAALPGQTLRVRVTVTSAFQLDSAILLGAATLQRLGSNLPPVAALVSPTNEANVVSGEIVLDATATDSDGVIQRVEFFSGITKLGEVTNAPYSFLWSNAPVGSHTITARARDDEGTNVTSAAVTVFIITSGGSILTDFSAPTGIVNLTLEGIADWVHWGLVTESTVNRKAGVPPLISNFSIVGLGPQYQFFDNFNGYTWTDGTPRAGVTNTTTGVYVFGVGNGFEIQAPATNAFRTLRVHLGAYAGRGKLQAFVTDYSAPVINNIAVDNAANGPGGIYTLTYRAASSGQKLIVRYTLASRYSGDGNVTLQAASMLSDNNPPTITLLAPTNQTAVLAGTNVLLSAGATDSDGVISRVEFFRNSTLVGVSSNAPYTVTLSNIAVGTHTITARAIDNGGAFANSAPALLFAITGTGHLRGLLTNPPAAVNLSVEGKMDWIHWALATRNSVNRRAGITPMVSDVTIIPHGLPQRYADNFTAFSWTNGTPTASAFGTRSGLYMAGLSNGFRITVPADTRPKRLNIYAGVYGARARFEATLSDNSAAPFINNQLERILANGYGLYTVDFAAGTNNQTLTVRYIAEALNDVNFGNVTWAAATLGPPPPVISILQPPLPGSAFSAEFFGYPGVSYAVEHSDTLVPLSWQSLTNIIGGGTNAMFSDLPPPVRLYRIKLN